MEGKRYGYYCLYRPPMPGTIPRGAIEIECLDDNPYNADIMHNVWGKVWYAEPLSEKDIHDYELASIIEDKKIYTICIRNKYDESAGPWVVSFDSNEKRIAFSNQIRDKMIALGVREGYSFSGDCGTLNDGEIYMKMLDDLYGEG